MRRAKIKPLSWVVKNYNCNADKIEDYDVLKHREDMIKRFKKKYTTKEEFADVVRRGLMSQYWSRCEYELIIEIDDDGHIWLKPWVGCADPEVVKIDVTDDENFDWRGFADKHIGRQIYKNKAKIDVWNQISYNWDEFIDYIWNYRHRYQRTWNNALSVK